MKPESSDGYSTAVGFGWQIKEFTSVHSVYIHVWNLWIGHASEAIRHRVFSIQLLLVSLNL